MKKTLLSLLTTVTFTAPSFAADTAILAHAPTNVTVAENANYAKVDSNKDLVEKAFKEYNSKKPVSDPVIRIDRTYAGQALIKILNGDPYVSVRSLRGLTPLQYVMDIGSYELAHALLDKGITPTKDDLIVAFKYKFEPRLIERLKTTFTSTECETAAIMAEEEALVASN
jgi:hypothetical protein